MTEIFVLTNVPYNIKIPRYLDSQLPKTAYRRIKIKTYKRPQLRQQLTEKKVWKKAEETF